MSSNDIQKIEADWRALLELSAAPEKHSKNLDLIYRATSAAASVGRTLPAESQLSESEQRLNEARRLLFASNFSQAQKTLESQEGLSPLLLGDRFCILALIAHRENREWARARDLMIAGANTFENCGEFYRMIRARINSLICARDLGEYDQGSLYAIEQECVRRGYHDQAGLIQRGRTIELLNEGKFSRAVIEGERALQSYSLDGCPEDRSVTQVILAISKALIGNQDEARKLESSVAVRSGRAESYLQILGCLFNGKTPDVAKNHPLGRVPWKKASSSIIRRSSTYGKLLHLISKRPYPRHELIEAVWGKDAGGSNYDNRLYVAIATLRKKHGIAVNFDGERYFLK